MCFPSVVKEPGDGQNYEWRRMYNAKKKKKEAVSVLKVLTLTRLSKRKLVGFWELIREQAAMVLVPQASAFTWRGSLSMQRHQNPTGEAGESPRPNERA